MVETHPIDTHIQVMVLDEPTQVALPPVPTLLDTLHTLPLDILQDSVLQQCQGPAQLLDTRTVSRQWDKWLCSCCAHLTVIMGQGFLASCGPHGVTLHQHFPALRRVRLFYHAVGTPPPWSPYQPQQQKHNSAARSAHVSAAGCLMRLLNFLCRILLLRRICSCLCRAANKPDVSDLSLSQCLTGLGSSQHVTHITLTSVSGMLTEPHIRLLAAAHPNMTHLGLAVDLECEDGHITAQPPGPALLCSLAALQHCSQLRSLYLGYGGADLASLVVLTQLRGVQLVCRERWTHHQSYEPLQQLTWLTQLKLLLLYRMTYPELKVVGEQVAACVKRMPHLQDLSAVPFYTQVADIRQQTLPLAHHCQLTTLELPTPSGVFGDVGDPGPSLQHLPSLLHLNMYKAPASHQLPHTLRSLTLTQPMLLTDLAALLPLPEALERLSVSLMSSNGHDATGAVQEGEAASAMALAQVASALQAVSHITLGLAARTILLLQVFSTLSGLQSLALNHEAYAHPYVSELQLRVICRMQHLTSLRMTYPVKTHMPNQATSALAALTQLTGLKRLHIEDPGSNPRSGDENVDRHYSVIRTLLQALGHNGLIVTWPMKVADAEVMRRRLMEDGVRRCMFLGRIDALRFKRWESMHAALEMD